LISYQKGAWLPGAVLGAILLVGLAGLLRFGRRDDRRWTILLLWGIAVSLLAIPPLTAQFDYRYVLPAVPFACTAACLAVVVLTRRTVPGTPFPTDATPTVTADTDTDTDRHGCRARRLRTRHGRRRGSGSAAVTG
jgi:hypothetical protein